MVEAIRLLRDFVSDKLSSLRKEVMKLKNKLDLMFESDFVRVPRPFIRKFNLNTAVMLSEIYSE